MVPEPQTFRKVIVVGASGNLGPHVLSALTKSNFEVSVLTREDSKGKFPSDVKVVKTDYTESSLVSALQGQDVVVSTIGGNALSTQTKIIDAAIKAGVQRFLPSEYGNDSDNSKSNEMVPFFQPKKVVLDHVRSKEKEISWTAIMTGVFFDWAMNVGFLGFDMMSSTATIWDDGEKHFCGTLIEAVATAIAAALSKPEETKNKVLYVASLDTTQNEMLAALEKHQGKKWTINRTTVEEQCKIGQAAMQKGDIRGALKPLVLSGVFSGHGSDFQGNGYKLDNALLEMPPPSLDAALQPVFNFFKNSNAVVEVRDYNFEKDD